MHRPKGLRPNISGKQQHKGNGINPDIHSGKSLVAYRMHAVRFDGLCSILVAAIAISWFPANASFALLQSVWRYKVRVDEIQKGHQQYLSIVDLCHTNVQVNITAPVIKLHPERLMALLCNDSVYDASNYGRENVFQLQKWNIVTLRRLAWVFTELVTIASALALVLRL